MPAQFLNPSKHIALLTGTRDWAHRHRCVGWIAQLEILQRQLMEIGTGALSGRDTKSS